MSPGSPQRDPEVAEWPTFASPGPGETVHRIDREASQVLIRVDPAGPMARLGHSHVIGGPAISGIVIADNETGDARLDLEIDATALEVDRPAWRRAEGLKPELDADAIRGTRANMRSSKVLDAARYPTITIRSVAIQGPGWNPTITARIRLRGEVRELAIPVSVFRSGRRVEAIGNFELLQSSFGIEPFSTAGGALRVSDRMRIRFRIVALNASQSAR